ncbi:MAG: hypothetical protein ABID38_03945 [Candidatus Diapherotrites archaeon]
MPELFKIGDGPWNMMFSGKFMDHEVDIYSNPDNVLLVLIWDRQGGNYKGAVIEIYKVFAAMGETENFVESLPREVIVLAKHTKEQTVKFFLLGGGASYVKYEERGFVKEIDSQLKSLSISAKMIKDVSKAYDLTLQDLKNADEEVRNSFFAQPLLIPIVTTAAHAAGGSTEASAIGKGEIMLGLTKDKNKVVEPISLFTRTIVSGGSASERGHFLHILAEGFLLSGIPVVIFERGSKFSGLGESSKELAELQKYQVEADPMGFPVKHYYLSKQIFGDLEFLSPEGMLDSFGVGENNVGNLIVDLMKSEPSRGMAELASKIRKTKPKDNATSFEIFKAARIISLMGSTYPNLFEGKNDLDDLSKKPSKGIGRSGIIHFEDYDLRASLIVIHNILNGLIQESKKMGATRTVKLVVILANAGEIIPKDNPNSYAKQFSALLSELNKYGIAFVLDTESTIDLLPDVANLGESKINIVGGNEAGVQIKQRKGYRVLLRPGLSACSEK